MNRRNIGGRLDVAAYSALAKSDPPSMGQARSEALRLFHEGRSARDIAEALRLHESLVQAWIAGATA